MAQQPPTHEAREAMLEKVFGLTQQQQKPRSASTFSDKQLELLATRLENIHDASNLTREINMLAKEGVIYVYQVLARTKEELKYIPNLGKKSVEGVIEKLKQMSQEVFEEDELNALSNLFNQDCAQPRLSRQKPESEIFEHLEQNEHSEQEHRPNQSARYSYKKQPNYADESRKRKQAPARAHPAQWRFEHIDTPQILFGEMVATGALITSPDSDAIQKLRRAIQDNIERHKYPDYTVSLLPKEGNDQPARLFISDSCLEMLATQPKEIKLADIATEPARTR